MLRKIGSALTATAICLSGTAYAEVIEEIITTAQKREQGINDVGITVNAFYTDCATYPDCAIPIASIVLGGAQDMSNPD